MKSLDFFFLTKRFVKYDFLEIYKIFTATVPRLRQDRDRD